MRLLTCPIDMSLLLMYRCYAAINVTLLCSYEYVDFVLMQING
jgi:hypothetical protein